MEAAESTPRARTPHGAWRARVLTEAQRLEDRLEALVTPPPPAAAEAFRRKIAQARAAATPEGGPVDRLRRWFSGADLETSWGLLHSVDEDLVGYQTPEVFKAQIPDVIAALEKSLQRDEPRLSEYRAALTKISEPGAAITDTDRATVRAAKRAAHSASDTAHDTVRRWRNLLLAVGVAVAVLDVVMAIVHAAVPDFLPLDGPDGEGPEVWEIEVLGAFGGAVAAVLAINRFSGFTDPHGLPIYQALLRIPMAAATALLGVLLMQSGVVELLDAQPKPATLAYAVLFGYAQEPLLRLVDRQAGEVLDPARSKDDPIAQLGTPPAKRA